MDINLLKKYYSGDNIKIALIDDGTIKRKVYKKIRLRNNKEKNITSSHASICADIIYSVCSNVKLVDISVTNENGIIFEEDIINGIKLALEMNVDIINISLGLESYSQQLYNICLFAYNSGVPIMAASGGKDKILYPSSLDCVFKVSSAEVSEDIEINGNEIFIDEKLLNLKGKYKDTPLLNSSFACSYASAYFALLWESRPLTDKNKLLKILSKSTNSHVNKNNEIYNKDFKALIIEPCSLNLSKYECILNKNFIKVDTLNLSNIYNNLCSSESEYPNIMIINPNNTKSAEISKFPSNRFTYIGNFDNLVKTQNNLFLDNHINYSENDIVFVSVPIVAIGSFGCNQSKYEILLSLAKGLTLNNISVSSITYNPLGILFGFNTFLYPDTIEFPNIVYSSNSILAKSSNKDIILIDLLGSICSLSDKDHYNFGMLCQAYAKAAAIDIFILCINSSIPPGIIKNQLQVLNSDGIKNFIFLISPITYYGSSIERSIKYFKSDEIRQKEYYYTIKESFSYIPTYFIDETDKICDLVINKLKDDD